MNECKDNLSEKSHWQKTHQRNFNLINTLSNSAIFQGFYHFVFFKIIKRFWNDGYVNMMEVGCAPGNYLVKFKKELGVSAYGVEYEQGGYEKTVENVAHYGIDKDNIILADFFDDIFMQSNKGKYDVVFSAGFIEHFKNPKDIIERQSMLVREDGMLICIIPNAKYLNELLSDKKTILLHNQTIMNPDVFASLFDEKIFDVQYCNYFGGLFNFGVFGQKTHIVNVLFKTLFIIQRILLDNIEKIYFILTKKDIISRYSSPALICIAKKKI